MPPCWIVALLKFRSWAGRSIDERKVSEQPSTIAPPSPFPASPRPTPFPSEIRPPASELEAGFRPILNTHYWHITPRRRSVESLTPRSGAYCNAQTGCTPSIPDPSSSLPYVRLATQLLQRMRSYYQNTINGDDDADGSLQGALTRNQKDTVSM